MGLQEILSVYGNNDERGVKGDLNLLRKKLPVYEIIEEFNIREIST